MVGPNPLEELQLHIDSLARRHPRAMGIAAHQLAGDVAVGNEQQPLRKLFALSFDHADFDLLPALTAGKSDSVTWGQSQPLHVARGDLQVVDLVLIFVEKFPFADAAALFAGTAWDENKRFYHSGYCDSPPRNIKAKLPMSPAYAVEEARALKAAIDAEQYQRARELLTANPKLHRAELAGARHNPLTWVAECRGKPPTPGRLELARWMIENGSDVHQGGDSPLMRAALFGERIPMMALLVQLGADVNGMANGDYPLLLAPCETLEPEPLKWLVAHGASSDQVSTDYAYGDCVKMLVSTYSRNPGKHACLEFMADLGAPLPDTAPMAVHRGRIDLLEACLQREPQMLERSYDEREIYPAELGIKLGDGLHCAPLHGATLLHMATEFQEPAIAQWLIDSGADVNARSAIDDDGFGGHTPLFHTTITLGPQEDRLAQLLLDHGADPSTRATIRKQLRYMGDEEKERMREYHNVTAIEFARQFQEPSWANEAAIDAIQVHERG